MSERDPLEPFDWKHRIFLLFDAPESVDRLRAAEAAINERQVLWFVTGGDALETNYAGELPADFASRLDAYRRSRPGTIEVVLIGKDGGVKSRDPKLDLEALFARIDAMPMRRAERREQAGRPGP